MIKIKFKTLLTVSFLMISVCGIAKDRENSSERANQASKSSPAASCKDYQFQLKDDAEGYESSIVSVVMDCHDATGSWPETTSINIISFDKKNGMCSTALTCGNVNGWMVDFEIGGSWSYGELKDFRGTYNNYNDDLSEGLKAVINLRRVNVDKYCTEKTKRICM